MNGDHSGDDADVVSERQKLLFNYDADVLHGEGFTKCRAVRDGSIFTFYKKDPVKVLQRQVLFVNDDDVYKTYDSTSSDANVMHAQLGRDGGAAIQSIVNNDSSDSVWWRTKSRDGEQSVPAFIQMYSDKSRTNLKAGGLTFYPLHILLMNIRHETAKRLISRGLTIVAYLPVRFYYETYTGQISEDNIIERLAKLRNLHYAFARLCNHLQMWLYRVSFVARKMTSSCVYILPSHNTAQTFLNKRT